MRANIYCHHHSKGLQDFNSRPRMRANTDNLQKLFKDCIFQLPPSHEGELYAVCEKNGLKIISTPALA